MKNAALLSAMVLAAVAVRALPTATLADHLIKGRSVDNAHLRARGTSTREGEQSFLRARNSASAHLPGMDHVADEVQLARSLVQEGSDYAALAMMNGKRDVSPAIDALDARKTPPGVGHIGNLGPIFNGKRQLSPSTEPLEARQEPVWNQRGGFGGPIFNGRSDAMSNETLEARFENASTPHADQDVHTAEGTQAPHQDHLAQRDATPIESLEARQGDGKKKLRWSDHPQHVGKRDLEPTQSFEVRDPEEMDHHDTIVTRPGSLGRREPMPSPVPQPKKQRGNSQAHVQKNPTKAPHGQTRKATRKPKKTKVGYVYPASKDPLAAF
ncbi:hypothetical protein IE81DRAFT_331858 [Ceraceosorus guamensis]|uniref:Uncharacterized protein n=1 Tax=Ceraceosorus guamensis TaxID=1522189 RepID=A0A316VRY2_9BASI|nr:hypothetical protein IE81DRAFT_331858 [Ceraceosorus guamensis]PWN40120.1 hypothetical protein IE81DRAFT_331858 [Ceraceosorus guamensis]